jgi:hypothetical protein
MGFLKFLICIILLVTILISCSPEGTPGEVNTRLSLVNMYFLQIDKPTGVTYDPVKNTLWITSGIDNKIYEVDE